MALLARVMSDQGFTPLQTMFWRCVVQTGGALVSCWAVGVQPLAVLWVWQRLQWVLVRAVFGGIGHLLYYMALSSMPLGPATVLFFTNPIFTALLAHTLLHEPFTATHRRLMLASLAGIALVVVHPTALIGMAQASIGPLCALAGTMAVALAYVSIRIAGSRVHAMVHVVYFGVVGAAGSLALSLLYGEPWRVPDPTPAAWAVVLGVGTAAFIAQFLMNRGLQLAAAGPVVMMRNADIVIGFVIDAVIYQTPPSLSSTIGACIIAASVFLMSR
ncbi:hypothetical protein H4R19_001817 [Coemansia spiralis]|nr:hypothetical protein H4R19_001817 [Coemansia spiralis]